MSSRGCGQPEHEQHRADAADDSAAAMRPRQTGNAAIGKQHAADRDAERSFLEIRPLLFLHDVYHRPICRASADHRFDECRATQPVGVGDQVHAVERQAASRSDPPRALKSTNTIARSFDACRAHHRRQLLPLLLVPIPVVPRRAARLRNHNHAGASARA